MFNIKKDNDKDIPDDNEKFVADLATHGYTRCEQIGKGGFGSIFVVFSEKYSELFVAKRVMNSEKALTEIKTLINLAHKNIIRFYEYFEAGEYLVMILEYCPNGDLQSYIDTNHVSTLNFYRISSQICEAVKYCHDHNICHRDIKPANILFDQYFRPKLSDFGLSKYHKKGTTDNSRGGSLPFMAPELFGNSRVDPFAADIWGLGVTLFVLAFKELPWTATDRNQMTCQIETGMILFPLDADQKIVYIIRKMLNIQIEKRFSIDKVIECIEKNKAERESTLKSEKSLRIPLTNSMTGSLTKSGFRLVTGSNSIKNVNEPIIENNNNCNNNNCNNNNNNNNCNNNNNNNNNNCNNNNNNNIFGNMSFINYINNANNMNNGNNLNNITNGNDYNNNNNNNNVNVNNNINNVNNGNNYNCNNNSNNNNINITHLPNMMNDADQNHLSPISDEDEDEGKRINEEQRPCLLSEVHPRNRGSIVKSFIHCMPSRRKSYSTRTRTFI